MDDQNNKPATPEATPQYPPNEVEPPTRPAINTPQPEEKAFAPTTPQVERSTPQPSEPGVTEPSVTAQPPMSAKPPKKGLFATLLIVAIIIVLGGAAALAYKFWYQNPEKVITDGLFNAMKAETLTFKAVVDTNGSSPGTLTISGDATKRAAAVDFDFTSKSDGMNYTIKGSGVYAENGDYYLKVKNVDELVDIMLAQQGDIEVPQNVESAINDFVAKVNDKWVKITIQDIERLSQEQATIQKCLQDTYKKLHNDKSYATEVGDLYKQHKFIVIKRELGSKDGSLGYEIETDTTVAKDFARGLKETKIYKSLQDCDDSFTIDENDLTEDTSSGENTTAEVWVSRWKHEITKLNLTSTEGEQQTSLVLETMFNRSATITPPEQSRSIEDLMSDIETLQTQIMSGYNT